MEDDNFSVRTPTQTEIATFQVMANLDFVDLKKPKPTSDTLVPRIEEEDEEILDEQPETPKILPPVLEENIEIVEDSPMPTPKSSNSSVVQNEGPTESNNTMHNTMQNGSHNTMHNGSHGSYNGPPGHNVDQSNVQNPLYAKAKRMTEMEILTEKEGLLAELQMMEKQGIIKLSREFTMEDSLEEIQFQVDRANTNYAAANAVELAKTGIRVGSKGVEIVARRFGTNALDGFSNNLCKDMSKFTRPLTKLYRKYWRRGGITSPETELAMIVLGSVAMTVVQNKDFGGLGNMVAGALGSSVPKAKPVDPPKPTYDIPKVPLVNTIPPMPTNITGKSISLKPPVIPSASWISETSTTVPTVPTVPSMPQIVPVPTVPTVPATKTITIGTPSSSVKRNRKQHSDESSIVL